MVARALSRVETECSTDTGAPQLGIDLCPTRPAKQGAPRFPIMDSLICQQCEEPLQLDASLIDLAPSAYDMVANNLPTQTAAVQARPAAEAEGLAQLRATPYVKSTWQRSRRVTTGQLQNANLHPNESFVILQDNIADSMSPEIDRNAAVSAQQSGAIRAGTGADIDQHTPSPLSHNLRSHMRLFNLLSSRTDIDHPLCTDCTQLLQKSLQKRLDELNKERDGYIAFEKEVRKEREKLHQNLSREDAAKQIERLKLEEALATEQLKEAERDQATLDEELRALEASEKALESEEMEFWRIHNEHLLAAEQQTAQLASLRAAYAADAATLEKLERTNVYNDAFCIGHDGVFGTINGLRLGRIPTIPVEWAEVNAAWGQTLLLLYTVARKLDYSFEHYRLTPMGSFSRIEKTTGDKTVYELYGSGDLHFGRLLHNRRFDLGMVAFLDCLKQIVECVKSQDPSVDFPHEIAKDRIGDVSIKLQFNQEESWTRALRHVLLALKICLKWATNGTNG
ncbi:APG6-domain-containing protein [Pluteus cervinus]|uniref:APG6-domain-containing protein n=1 Tax=Pluteus cervinus TaxID=181527 RepID=A0ACD3AT16_9AGAR|nr:APG6-domain-containing protein [Pluteus cervinus]